MATTPSSHTNLSPRRRSQRVLMQVAVRIRGTDAQGRKFEEDASTLAINAHGALVLLQARLTNGSRVLMQHRRTHVSRACSSTSAPCALIASVDASSSNFLPCASVPRMRTATCINTR